MAFDVSLLPGYIESFQNCLYLYPVMSNLLIDNSPLKAIIVCFFRFIYPKITSTYTPPHSRNKVRVVVQKAAKRRKEKSVSFSTAIIFE